MRAARRAARHRAARVQGERKLSPAPGMASSTTELVLRAYALLVEAPRSVTLRADLTTRSGARSPTGGAASSRRRAQARSTRSRRSRSRPGGGVAGSGPRSEDRERGGFHGFGAKIYPSSAERRDPISRGADFRDATRSPGRTMAAIFTNWCLVEGGSCVESCAETDEGGGS